MRWHGEEMLVWLGWPKTHMSKGQNGERDHQWMKSTAEKQV